MKRFLLSVALCAVVGGMVTVRAFAQGATPAVTYTVTIYMANDETVKLEVSSDTYKNFNKASYLTSLLASPVWMVTVEDRTIIIPTANILYIETTPALAAASSCVLKGHLLHAPAGK